MMLQNLYDRGLRALTISYDDYHREYIPLIRIQNVLDVIKKFDISVALNMVVDKKNRGTQLLNDLGDSVFGIQVTMIPASPVGNSKMIPKQDMYLKNYESFDLRCPSSCLEFVIHHDGFVYPCCSPSVFESNLVVGNIREEQIDILEEKMFSNIALYILMKEGLGWFIEKLNISEELSKKQFVSTCEICRYLFSKESVFDLLYDEMLIYYEKEGCFV